MREGDTPPIDAARRDRAAKVATLLADGAGVDEPKTDGSGKTALFATVVAVAPARSAPRHGAAVPSVRLAGLGALISQQRRGRRTARRRLARLPLLGVVARHDVACARWQLRVHTSSSR